MTCVRARASSLWYRSLTTRLNPSMGRLKMFCYQCEQVSKGKGCTVQGVRGKDETTSALQDLLLYAVKGVSMYAHRAHALGARDEAVDEFAVEAVFSTLTNVDFDPA